jgi:hypothetical protein
MSLGFQNIDPPPSLCPASVSSPRNKGEGTHSPGGEGDGGSIFWKMRDIGLPSYSNNLSTVIPQYTEWLQRMKSYYNLSTITEIEEE